LCHWKVAADGIDLLADVRCGGVGVELGGRNLAVCTLTARPGKANESAFAAARAFCPQMCPNPRPVRQPVYGFNDWYCAYGKNTAENFLKDAAFTASLSPTSENQPYMVIDDGWQAGRQGVNTNGNPWTATNEKFGSTMPEIARAIKAMHARPGLWYRPLRAWPDCPRSWRLAARPGSFDPSNPEVLKAIAENVERFRSWGYELVKHDFSTFEIFGSYGNQMGEQVARDGWAFSDRSRTTAEIILNFYRTLREAAGEDVLLDGCNTMSHLSAGIFDLDRIGDDTSGREWNRTHKMGVNSLAFRGFQNGAFYLCDPDCSGLSRPNAIPWEKNRQWLDLIARSGFPFFVSWPQRLVGPEQEKALRAALSVAAQPQAVAEPTDWMETTTPSHWTLNHQPATFQW
jgi:alpha-galactosidase